MAGGGGFLENPYLWTSLALATVVGGVIWKGRGAILGGLDKRADEIRAKIEEAEKLREEAQVTLASYQRKQRDALQEAEQILAHAKEEAQRIRKVTLEDLERTLERREKSAMDKIAQAEANALAQVRNMAVDLAISAAGKVLTEKMTKEEAAKLIDDSIADLPNRLN